MKNERSHFSKIIDETTMHDLYKTVTFLDALSGNEIVCDCNIAWLVRAENSIGNRLQRSYCAHNSFPISQMPADFFDDVCPQN